MSTMLYKERYQTRKLRQICNVIIWFGRYLPCWSIDHLVASVLPPCSETEDQIWYLCNSLPWIPVYAVIVIFSLAIKALLFPVFIAVTAYQAPYVYVSKKYEGAQKINYKTNYTVCSANICLLGETVAHVNSLGEDTNRRGRQIGKEIVNSQCCNKLDVKMVYPNSGDDMSSPENLKSHNTHDASSANKNSHILTSFPANIDFFCFQEVTDFLSQPASNLMEELSVYFEYFIFDVGSTGWRTYFHIFDSGLMFASRYPILDIQFHPFSNVHSFLKFASFGVLSVKVDLGMIDEDKRVVGYLATTHLQPLPGDQHIHSLQMDEILKAQDEFRIKSLQRNDLIVFDVLCGDFNFDNMSPGEKGAWTHRLFEVYDDVCRERPGQDHRWTVGTEMRLATLLDKEVSTSQRLKAVLEDEHTRAWHVYDADIQKTMTTKLLLTHPDVITRKKRLLINGLLDDHKKSKVDGKRRIDLILHRKDTPVEVADFSFVTQLARLTDHIPVTMSFRTNVELDP
ncbi:sphingomyelin phosphodiesterase 3-like [Glandiceps talaboti]